MKRHLFIRALLAGSALILAAPAWSQDTTPAAAAPEPTEPDPSDTAADAAIAAAAPVDDAQAKIELLAQQVEALQSQLEVMKASLVKATPSWKGGPEWADKDSGFSFKPKGFMQFDAGYVGFPNGDERRGSLGGINYGNLGFNTRARRLVFGAEGGLPGGFKYKAEFNFAQGVVDYEDIILSYDFKNQPLTLTIGNFYPYSSLETVTSSRLGSMLERASFTDAFNYNRRLGVGLSLADKKADRYTLSAGLFSREINDNPASFTRTGWEASIRGTYTPPVGPGFVHLGASYHHRVNNQEALAQQYRSRPLTQITDQRFVDTGNIASNGDDSVGVEFGGVFKSFHFAAEAQKLWVRNAYSASEIASQNAAPGTNDTIPGGAVALNGNPSFEGAYGEVGYYFTGESRGYKGGKWDRTKVLKPFDKGGWGAIQFNARVDYLNLNDGVGAAGTNRTVANPNYVNGGKQVGYQLSLIWNPMDYLRFMAQYGHVDITGGPRAVSPLFSAVDLTPINRREYKSDSAAVRAQLEF
ncbi:MAG: porin [Sphingomicrobium sp.]